MRLTKLYIEPTNCCNMGCRTCIRNVWQEHAGSMTEMVFYRILEGLRAFSPVPLAFFGGMGESLLHPRIMEMTAKIKTLGARVELITNGTLLTPEMTHGLLDAVVDMLWVSLDGATSETYYRSVDTSTSI